jgi:putative MFS transporter
VSEVAGQPTVAAGVSPVDFEPPNITVSSPDLARSDSYLRLLLVLLVSASFFEGYDGSIVALLLPNIQSTFHVSEATLGLTRVFSVAGSFAAFFLARSSDRVGRRPLLLWSVLGYTLFTALTAFSWSIWSFAAFQFSAGVFLGTEFAVAITMIVEEFPSDRRGRALGILLTFSALGAVVVAVLLFGGLADTALEWRAFYLVGLIPLVTLAFFRPRLKETRRFIEEQQRRREGKSETGVPFLAPWQPQYRRNLVLVGLVHTLRSVPVIGATSWWAYYAERERGFTSKEVAVFIGVSYGLGTFGYYVCGRMMERLGRRPTAMVYFVGGISFSMLLFQVSSKPVAFVALMFAVFFGLGMGPVLSAFATELFPTEIRGAAAAWIRNWFEISGIFFGPLLVGVLGDHSSGAIGNIGDTVTLLMVLQIPCIWIVWRYMPETRGKELEQIAEDEGMVSTGAVVV